MYLFHFYLNYIPLFRILFMVLINFSSLFTYIYSPFINVYLVLVLISIYHNNYYLEN